MRGHRLQNVLELPRQNVLGCHGSWKGETQISTWPPASNWLHLLNFSFSVSFSKDECQGLLRAGHRAHHSARHTGGPQLERLPALFTSLPGLPPGMASLIDKARPQFWHPDQLLEATTERCLAAPGQLPLSRGSYCSSQPQARGSKTPGRQGKQASCGAGEPVPLLRSKGCESGTSR